jgi:hypothetical protein
MRRLDGRERAQSVPPWRPFSVCGGIAALSLVLVLASVGVARGQETTSTSRAEESESKELGLSVSLTPEYSAGTYGTQKTTEVLYVPLVLQYSLTDRLDIKLTVPYIRQRGQGVLGALGIGALAAPGGVSGGRTGRTTTDDGLGDILLEGNYRFTDDRGLIPEVTGLLEIKFPTADGRRLGSGEFDELLGANLTKKLSERWTATLEVSYTFVGSPPRLRLDNSFGWTIGPTYAVTPAFRLSAYIEGATAVVPGTQNPLDFRWAAEYDLTERVLVTGSATKGSSDGSPAFGISAGLGYRF